MICFANDRALIDVEADPPQVYKTPLGDIERKGPVKRVLLGLEPSGDPLFAQFIEHDEEGKPTADLPASVKAIDLRSLATQDLVSVEEFGMLAYARSMLNWHATHQFCAYCGAPTHMVEGGDRRKCDTCTREHFPRTDPVVIIIVYQGDRCLMGRSKNFVEGMYSALAGFMEPGETLEDAARREVLEESGIHVGKVTYVLSQPWPFVSSLMIGLLGEALDDEINIDPHELEDARWFSREEAQSLLDGTHPEGLKAPNPFAIAHHLLLAYLQKT
ncbi:MAG: NAD(+) diphosphatase [Alphaproteobacteria bacterium]|nr:NAD(+) diphosphatase [Alphaproteobacteria bacterium]